MIATAVNSQREATTEISKSVQEAARAAQEAVRAERLAERLRALGVDPSDC